MQQFVSRAGAVRAEVHWRMGIGSLHQQSLPRLEPVQDYLRLQDGERTGKALRIQRAHRPRALPTPRRSHAGVRRRRREPLFLGGLVHWAEPTARARERAGEPGGFAVMGIEAVSDQLRALLRSSSPGV